MFGQDKNAKRNIFRQESLEQLSSPERLDQLMQAIGPKDWLPLKVLGSLVFAGLVWSIFGRIPIAVEGRGILIDPRRVANLESPISGQLSSLNVQAGQCVARDELLATIEPSELRQRLRSAQNQKTELQRQFNETTILLYQGANLEKEAIAASQASIEQSLRDTRSLTPILKDKALNYLAEQRRSLQQRLEDTQALTPILKDKGLEAIAEQRNSLQQRLGNAKKLSPILRERLEKRQALAATGAIEQDTVLQAEQEYIGALENIADLEAELKNLDVRESDAERQYLENLSQIGNLQSQLKDLDVKEVEAEKQYLDNLNRISQLETELQELETRKKRLEQENLQQLNSNKNQIQEVEREIAQLEQRIAENSKILSPKAGCILEITATTGQVVSPGTRLGSMNIAGKEKTIMGVSYFAISDGKKIALGMPIQITPDIVKRQRFGGITGTVTSISEFPVTQEGAATIIGNQEVVSGLISGGGVIEIWAELDGSADSFSGYKWSSSQGPKINITPGTTTTAIVHVEQRAPITFVLPILREWTGIY